jgi:hypothetical protein
MKIWMKYMVCLFLAAMAMTSQASAANTPAITVGRVYTIEGDLLRYIPEEKDWVPMVNDAPFGTEDALFSGEQGKAEMNVPNGTWLRVGNSTQVQFIALDSELSEMDVATGVARFYNKGSETVIKATSPFGYVLAYPGTVFDFYVGDTSVEVVAVKGSVSFVHKATEARYEVAAGAPSILADARQVSSGDGTVDPEWDSWNATRDDFWEARTRIKGHSVEYLPATLQSESYALEENGRWESVPYEGSSRWFWRPTTVSMGWSPFTTGRWTDWNGDQVWIPAEPFGYVTHHYGNWIYVRNSWYWAPPVVRERVGLPLLDIDFSWSPGRVSWIHHDNYVGWVPLAPRETYYSHRNWGGRHEQVIINNITQININIGSYAYVNQAIVVPRDNFYREENYRNVRVTNIRPDTIARTYRAAPIVNNTVLNNYMTNKQRHNFTNRTVKEKPHISVINRIEENTPIIQRGKREKADIVRKQVRNLKEGRVNRDNRIERPKTTNPFVPANDVNKPKSEMQGQPREIKSGESTRQPIGPRQVRPVRPAQLEQPVERFDRLAPTEPNQKVMPPDQTIESPRGKRSERGMVTRPREVKPTRNDAERAQEIQRPELTPERPVINQQDRRPAVQPRVVRPDRNDVERPREIQRPEQAPEGPLINQQDRRPAVQPRVVRPDRNDIERPREIQRPEQAPERPVINQQDRRPAVQPRVVRPDRNDVERPREIQRPEQAPERPVINQQDRRPIAQPREVRPDRNNGERPGVQMPEKNTGKQQEPTLTKEELEKLRLLKKLEEEKNNQKGNNGKQ